MRVVRVIAVVLTALAATAARADDAIGCRSPAIGSARVQAAIDARTLRLDDGREVRLAGIEIPDRPAAAQAAQAALATLTADHEVNLWRLGPETDRYGRVLAHVVLPAVVLPAVVLPAVVLPAPAATAEPRSVQQDLLAKGHARVAARVGDRACAAAFLLAEQAARAAGLGLWADPHYLIKRAQNPDEILAERGRFALVEGKVLSVRESGGVIYVNFGRRWSDDFTVTVLKRSERSFAAAGLELRKLAGHRVRVRGTIEERGGPWIEATRPEQIELAAQN